MNTTELSEWRLRRGKYLGDISALCFLHLPAHLSSLPLLLAGTGSQILVYELENGKILSSFQIFEGIRVHGISLDHFHKQLASPIITIRIAVYGERRVKLFTLKIESDGLNEPFLKVELTLIHSLPKFGHWVLDVCFLKDGATSNEDAHYLAVGCSDNAVYFWDIWRQNVFSEVKCAERCLLYSMKMLGNTVEGLCIASGTIFNEIVVWKVVHQNHATVPGSNVEDHVQVSVNGLLLRCPKYTDVHISKLIGHEGSIFGIAWFPNGLKLVSVSDDRSARIWEVQPEKGAFKKTLEDVVNHSTCSVLFGHSARIWDCCIFDTLIITAGEDCTCRVWDHDGRELNEIKEHVGRGIWRCLYDPNSSLLVTAGFDSAIKVHLLFPSSKVEGNLASKNSGDRNEVFALSIPNSSGYGGLIDSKSEYVRCLQFSCEDSLYVATNNGYLYHVSLLNNDSVKWTELACISRDAPIICMDLSSDSSSSSARVEDCIAIGDGKGIMTIVKVVVTGSIRKVESMLTWSAEKERHLLGTFWCKAADNRFIFTADPGGRLMLWKLCHNVPSASLIDGKSNEAFLIAEYASCFGMRIMCVDASFDEELLVCGDIRGNLLLFSLPRDLQFSTSVTAEVKATPPINYFKFAHGVSSVCSVSIIGLSSDQVDIHSTGTDGCICYLRHDKDSLSLEFIGMKQVKELSAVRSVFFTADNPNGSYAIGFSSENFIIWNLTSEAKVIEITCGGWRRPHSYYLGDCPEMMNCFSFVKNDVIHIHRHWVAENNRQIYPQNLHFQFHGREIHSLCFISGHSCSSDENPGSVSGSSWIATGCEDGTVRLTRYELGIENWSSSKYLGEHVGGSAVRSVCFLSKMHIFTPDAIADTYKQNGGLEDIENSSIVISVGAKRVITAWKQMTKMSNFTDSSLSFQWLSTDMPSKHTNYVKRKNKYKTAIDLSTTTSDVPIDSLSLECKKMESNSEIEDNHENDWRYLDVTAFHVKDAFSRTSVCFVIIACSDATVNLRALVLPCRLWFNVASFAPLTSPVLALQHVVIPVSLPSKGNAQIGNVYLAITGSTDGSIAFWDLTKSVENFMKRISTLKIENYKEFQKRPRTGRGSQGGQLRKSLDSYNSKKTQGDGRSFVNSVSKKQSISMERSQPDKETENLACASLESRRENEDLFPETSILVALHLLNNVHQSGVNCLHVSDVKVLKDSDFSLLFYVVSGGDDQAINCLRCDLENNPTTEKINFTTPPQTMNNFNHYCKIQNHEMRVFYLDRILSAHSSAVKGIWTDGIWIFSAGLDQRVRCWKISHDGVTEYAHIIISVPEPEALDVQPCGRDYYRIAVAGRGMQMVECFHSDGLGCEK